MRQSLITPGTTVTVRCLNGGSGQPANTNSNNGGGAVTYVRLGPAATITQVPSPGPGGVVQLANQVNFVAATQQQQQLNGNGTGAGGGGNGNQVVFRRLANNNIVQIRRIITQQPQQLQQVTGDLSSSDSSVGFERSRMKNGRRMGGIVQDNDKDNMCLDDDDSMGEVAVSIVDRGEGDEDDDEDLLMDQDEDDGGVGDVREDGDNRTALEMNGDGVDSDHLRHVIETQIMNRHKAKIKDWDGTKGHICQSCHETFLSENGLETHRNRRIHHILFFCRCCKRDISFFNKCRLLQHLRNHRVTPTVTALQNCVMIRLLPESDYLHFKYEECTSSSDEDDKGGSGGGSGGSSSNPPKRLKPSKFRRVARSSLSGNGLDSPDHSPPPNVTKQIVAPPQQLSATTILTPPHSSSSVIIVSTSANASNAIGTIKYATSASNGNQPLQQRGEPVTVIKSTDNTTSVILPSPASVKPPAESPPPPKLIKQTTATSSSPTSPSDGPQIRIRNLSQITVSVNDEGEEEDQNGYGNDHLKIEPVVQMRPPVVKPSSQANTPTTSAPALTVCVQTQKPSNSETQSQQVVTKEYRCHKCDTRYNSNREFFKHLEEQEASGLSSRSLHRCPTDDIPSWSQCQYVFHTKVFHEQSVPFMCPGCGNESPDYNALMEHVTNNCFYLSQRVRYMCAAADQKCSFIDKKSVKTEPEIIDHLKREHSRAVLQCVHCTQGFATENWLLKHLGESHKITYDDSKGDSGREALINKATRPLTQCLICNILFPNGPTYLQHVYLNFHMHILHAKMLECQSCFAVFETTDDIMNHRKQNDKCRKMDPFHMKICTSANETSGGISCNSPPSMAPTPIKIIANPAVISATSPVKCEQQQSHPQVKQQIIQRVSNPTRSQPQPATVVAVISTAHSNDSQVSAQQQQQNQRSQKPPLPCAQPKQVNCIQQGGQNPSRPMPSHSNSAPVPPANRNIAKKNFFDELQSCQFCERLVVFSSLRKHEDQCCGLSTVAPGFCLTCRQNFGDKKTLARHGIVHIQEGLPICLFCNNRHIRPTHPKSLTPSSHENLYALKKHLYSNHTSKAVHFPFQCPLCSKVCNDKRTTEFHIKDHQFKYVKSEADPVPLPTSLEDIQKLIKVRRKGGDPRRKVANKIIDVYYCPVCKNREFAQESGLARHLKLVHQKSPKSVNLGLLKKASSARRFVLKSPESATSPNASTTPHRPQLRSVSSSSDSRARPGGAAAVATRGSGNNNVTISSHSPSTSFTSRFSSGVVLRKRIGAATSVVTGRKPPTAAVAVTQKTLPTTRLRTPAESPKESPKESTRPPSNFLQTRSSSSSPSKTVRKKDGTFTCLKCPEFSCKTENAFCEHIKWKHIWSEAELQKLQYGNKAGLEERSEYWCPECNTMFVAKPSLVRHLKYAHDYISNTEDYMQKIGYDGKKPLKPNQCEVCYYQCADDRELQQHIRTHGMAFLRLRQQRQLSGSKS